MNKVKFLLLSFLSAFAADSVCSIRKDKTDKIQKKHRIFPTQNQGLKNPDGLLFNLSPSMWASAIWNNIDTQEIPISGKATDIKKTSTSPSALPVKDTKEISADQRSWAAVYNGAVGDALGRVTEFIENNTQNITNLDQAFRKEHGFANYTDDTVMALIVAEEMKKAREKNLTDQQVTDALAHRFAALLGKKTRYSVDPLFDIRTHGPGNQSAAEALSILIESKQNNAPSWWLKRNQDKIKTEAGCGSVMRAWPIGLVFHDNLERAALLADMQSQITHRHPLARAASAALAVGTALAYNGKPVQEIVEGMISAAAKFEPQELIFKKQAQKKEAREILTAAMIAGDKLLTSDMLRYASQVAQEGKEPAEILGTNNAKGLNFRSPHGFLLGWAADEAVSAALYLFVRHAATKNIDAAIAEGVNTPGDSDSIASLAGVLMGAYTGRLYQNGKNSQLLEGVISGKLKAAARTS